MFSQYNLNLISYNKFININLHLFKKNFSFKIDKNNLLKLL